MAKHLKATEHDIGGLFVKRVLPHIEKKMVGPFIFLDHMGPSSFESGQGINVRPHPHIGLSTLTYLFDGAILHRDSLGNNLEIQPGDVNWMTAGKGIVHSERESFETRSRPHSINGLQCWIALPEELAEIEPSFIHIKKEQLPVSIYEDVMIRLIAGEAYEMSSPVKTYSPLFYLDITADKGSLVERPNRHQEAAIYCISGSVEVGGINLEPNQCALLEPNDDIIFASCGRVVVLGGEKYEKAPHVHWNFVSFSRERIQQAREDWSEGRFPTIPGDRKEHIPLPERKPK
ncbi:pirin family protein [Vibrio ishigakensis]|nr:pirin family protein [Vibrio ishigakensis]